MIILSEIETLEQLKKKGPFNKVKASINEIIPIKARGWDHLWAKILELRIYAKCNDIFRTANLLRIKDISGLYAGIPEISVSPAPVPPRAHPGR